MKALQIVLGVLVALAGIYCCTYPIETQVSLSGVFVIVLAIGMLVDGVGEILSWNHARKFGMSSIWTLLAGIVSIILGIILLSCDFFAAGIVYATFCAYFLCAWLIFSGITRIITAVKLRELSTAILGDGNSGSGWVLVLILGILMVVAGICCFGSPVALIGLVGIVFGVSMVIAGISLISLGIAAPARR